MQYTAPELHAAQLRRFPPRLHHSNRSAGYGALGGARYTGRHRPLSGGGLGFKAAEGHFRRHTLRYSGLEATGAPGPAGRAGPFGELVLSSLGVGTYLGAADGPTDEAVANAIVQSVANGWNVIDTAANYRWGRAEKSVGRSLHMLRMMGGAAREELFVSTKAGYAADDIIQQLRSTDSIAPGDVVSGHCMHPACLEASLERSLESLGLATVDLFYIHNPAESQLRQLGRAAFMQRLRAAFEFCEGARAGGRIKAYGVASWSCFRSPPEKEREHLSLRELVQLAEDVGGPDRGFGYIQLPTNAAIPEAWAEPWQEGAAGSGERTTLLQAAEQLGVGVFSSGPLMEGKLLQGGGRLGRALDAAPELGELPGTAPKLLQIARSTSWLLSTLVGHKTQDHVTANLALTRQPPLGRQEFVAAVQAAVAAL